MFDKIPTFPIDQPMLRPLEMMPVRLQQGEGIMVQDPLGVLPGPALLAADPLLLVFIEMADGRTPLAEMAQRVTMMSGQIIPVGIFESMAKQLDEALLLQSETFAAALKKKYDEWNAMPTRPYKTVRAEGLDRLKMLKDLGEEFRRHRLGHHAAPERLPLPNNAVRAILSPHIDYGRGGEAYSWAYRALKEHGTGAKTFIILGTNHRPAQRRFIASKKNYDTPFGVVETNQDLLQEIVDGFGEEIFDEEFLHADEHTIELQAIYLRHLYGDAPIKIVPILVSSFDDLLHEEGANPKADPEIDRFLKVLRSVLEKHGDDVALIGGVDFSHCGPAFGDEKQNDADEEKAIEAEDRSALTHVESITPDSYFEAYRPTLNGRHVCSIGTVYCVLEAMRDNAKGKLLSYQQANSADRNTLVSFCAAAFIKPDVEDKPAPRIILATR